MEILSVDVDGLLMKYAEITSSSTCGMEGPEVYCKLVDERMIQLQYKQESQVLCDVCDDRNETQRHSIEFAKSEDDHLWWQSPSMAQGLKYQHVNVTIDLKQVYQIVYILLRMGNSPRPGNWILERSINGSVYYPWIFFAETPYSCYNLFQRHYPDLKLTTRERPNLLEDDEMFCTTYYSQPKSLNSGEIIISLINGRKSLLNEGHLMAKSIPQKLIDFLSARFIRFRFLKHLTLSADLMTHKGYLETSIYNRYFYSLRNVEIGGKCICNNHANKCDKVIINGVDMASCDCQHNTCGRNCEKCCPLFNQKPWKPIIPCEECNCNRKSKECVYNQTIANLQMSTNKMGRMEGGGVCLNCQENTEGINCEKCKKGFFRPWNVLAIEQFPCQPCSCDGVGTIGNCVSNGEEINSQKPGDCICRIGYTGEKCESCDVGYERNANGECLPCPCSIDGSLMGIQYRCKPPCNCKLNVDSKSYCKTCKNGFFNLDPKNADGCSLCYCFGITNQCSSLNARNLQIRTLSDWKLSTIDGQKQALPKVTSFGYLTSENNYLDNIFDSPLVYYWEAPQPFLGNLLTSYGSILRYVIKIELLSSIEGSQIDSPDVIIKCNNLQLFHSVSNEERRLQRTVLVYLKPIYWSIYKLIPERKATKNEFFNCLVNVDSLKIKAKYYSNQNVINLLNINLPRGEPENALNEMPFIEKCQCPPDYKGLSCETCDIGHRRVNNTLFQGRCEPCTCYNRSNTCDSVTGQCKHCRNNTTGFYCDECISGFYGNPKLKISNPCKKCACPLLKYQMSDQCSSVSNEKYVCHGCKNNTMGAHCERCAKGYFGNPRKQIYCQKCKCNDNQRSCSKKTGKCNCAFNTSGLNCENCKTRFFGNALNKTCRKCDCQPIGSLNQNCNKITGQCSCQPNFVNLKCDVCSPGFYIKEGKCIPCTCNVNGRILSERFCNATTGQCYCLGGINGKNCNQCSAGHYNYPRCKPCQCSFHALSTECDKNDGRCLCGANVIDQNCNKCQNYFYWKNNTHCTPCNCGKGAIHNFCDMNTGKCLCASNVYLRDCSKCENGYYGLGLHGCKKCPNCNRGKLCNDYGQCVCPPNTIGEFCEKCDNQSWNYTEIVGCKRCDCFLDGSSSKTCNNENGQCLCLAPYTGLKCSMCKAGYYNFPNCQSCHCSKSGTIMGNILMCNSLSGQCQCKPNFMGQKCNFCKTGTFHSSDKYTGGCFSCFCSGVTDKCEQLTNFKIIGGSNYKYQIFDNKISLNPGEDYRVINLSPSYSSKINWPLNLHSPIFVNVLQYFQSNDLSLFYRSTIMNVSIRCSDENCGRQNTIQHEVILESYGGLIELRFLVNYSLSNDGHINIELSEQSESGQWYISKYKNIFLDKFILLGDPNQIDTNLARDIFILALLNVTSFKIQLYSNKRHPQFVNLKLVTFNIIETISDIGKPVTTVEKCKCNSITSGNHCQKPIQGFYKEKIDLPEVLITVDLRINLRVRVELKKCICNGHSDLCNPNTGECYNCLHNTTGKKCELCKNGFYGQAINNGICQSCDCPTKNHNFAKTCDKSKLSPFIKCTCERNYTGVLCEKCEAGFFGNPIDGISCKGCECHPEGSQNQNCDKSGVCQCVPGVLGVKCDKCAPNHVLENKSCRSCYVGCTKDLINRIDDINSSLVNIKTRNPDSKIFAKVLEININIKDLSKNLELMNRFYVLNNDLNLYIIQFKNITDISNEKYSEAEKLKAKYNQVMNKLLFIFTNTNETMYGKMRVRTSNEIINNANNILKIMRNLLQEVEDNTEVGNLLQKVLEYKDELNKTITKTEDLILPDHLTNLKILKDNVIMANDINQDNIAYLKSLEGQNKKYSFNITWIEKQIDIFETENKRIAIQKEQLQIKIDKLKENAKDFQEKTDQITTRTLIIEKLIKNISTASFVTNKLFIPDQIRKHVEEQIMKSSMIIKNLTKEFTFLHHAEQAKEAYSNISRDIIDVDKQINETQEQLKENEMSVKINNITKMIAESYFNKSDLQKLKNESESKYQDSKTEYDRLKAYQTKVKLENDKFISEIPSQSYDIKSLKGNLTLIQSEQSSVQKGVLKLNESLSDLFIPKLETSGSADNMEKYVQGIPNLYGYMVNESEDLGIKIKNLRKKIRALRESLHKAKVIAELTHGAAARSAEPIRHVTKCVRHYITYYLPTSNAFSLKFLIQPQFPDQSLVLFGYDNSGFIPHAFAFTIEKNNKYKFWYDYGEAVEYIELSKEFLKHNYFDVSITWKLGKWEMVIKSIIDGEIQMESAQSSSINILNIIRTGPKTNVFLGGFPNSQMVEKLNLEGKLISILKENYYNSYYKGCVFGVRFGNLEFGLQDINAIDEDCKKMITIDNLLFQQFNCKVNLENVNKLNEPDRRIKREVEKEFDIHLRGNGYGMINTSNIKNGNCKNKLNKVLSISSITFPVINAKSFQLIAVFANHKKDFGFVLGQKYDQYHFGYWTENHEKALTKLQNSSQSFNWNIFKTNFKNIQENIFGIEDICDPNSYLYLGDIPYTEIKLIEKLRKLNVPNFGFTGKMKIQVNQKDEFQILATRFINVIYLNSERMRNLQFHSILISSESNQPIEINKLSFSDILNNGFGFSFDFMGQPINNSITLLTIELSQGKIQIEISKDLVLSLIINEHKIEKDLPKLNDKKLDWGPHYIVVFLYVLSERSILSSILLDDNEIRSKEIAASLGGQIRVIIGSNSKGQHSYYLYNLFLGQKIVDFNEMTLLPPGVFPKMPPSKLQPEDIQVESKDLIQSTIIPEDYPVNSAWFDGVSNNFVNLSGIENEQFFNKINNEISLMIRSPSLRSEMVMSFNFGSQKVLNVMKINGQITLSDSLTNWKVQFPTRIINEEWHVLKFTASSQNPERGIKVFQDKHIFDFPITPFAFTKPHFIEIGGFLGQNPKFIYGNFEYEVQYFTGCIDSMKLNNKTLRLNNELNGNTIKQCPKVLEFLNTGGHILDSYSQIHSASNLIKLKIGTYSTIGNENSYKVNFKFKYTGFEYGTLLVTGDGSKFCSMTIRNNEIYLNYRDFETAEAHSDLLKIPNEKWYSVQFQIYQNSKLHTICKLMIGDTEISFFLSGKQMFSANFKEPSFYFGSHPNLSLQMKSELTQTDKNFVGCISDLAFTVSSVTVPCGFEKSDFIITDRCSVDKKAYLTKKI